MTKINFAKRAIEARKHSKLSRKDAAAKIGIAYSTLSDIENGYTMASTHTAKMASVYGVSAVWLETGEGMMEDARKITGYGRAEQSAGEVSTPKLNELATQMVRMFMSLPDEAQDRIREQIVYELRHDEMRQELARIKSDRRKTGLRVVSSRKKEE